MSEQRSWFDNIDMLSHSEKYSLYYAMLGCYKPFGKSFLVKEFCIAEMFCYQKESEVKDGDSFKILLSEIIAVCCLKLK